MDQLHDGISFEVFIRDIQCQTLRMLCIEKTHFDDQGCLVADVYRRRSGSQLEWGKLKSSVRSPIAGLLVGTYGLLSF